MRIGYYQFAPEFGAVDQNLQTIESAVANARADLLVLPELCTTGYQFVSREETIGLAEEVPDGRSCRRLIEIARNTGMHLVAGIAECDGDSIYNTAVLVGPDGFSGHYRKVHLFFEETLWFTPGLEIPRVFDLNFAKIGIIICFDWFFPEIFRILVLQGAEVVVQPANLVLPYCQAAMKTRSIENGIFTVTANRIGGEARNGKPLLTFTGGSQVTDVKGYVLVHAERDREALHVVEIDPALARDKSINRYNSLLGSRRPDLYGMVAQKRK